jgi:outer membrane protein, heavy metal efflux system
MQIVRFLRCASCGVGIVGLALAACSNAVAQQSLTWDQVRARFEASNPALKADADNVDEMKAEEVTAFLRPNPQFTLLADGTQIAPHDGIWLPFRGTYEQLNFSYLHERDHKRELRLESAQEGTRITQSQHEDLDRNMIFALRTAFVGTLQAKFILDLAKADLDYYDKIIAISQDRFKAGDLASIDLDRIELLRVQYEAELQTAIVNLRTAKIQLLQLLNDRTPVEQFDVTGSFDFSDALQPLDDFRQIALSNRPDLQAALETIQQSETNHKLAEANGSTDPTFGAWYTYNSSNNNPNGIQTLGASVSIPLRIFDRNQGEKQRTQIDIDRSRRPAKPCARRSSATWTRPTRVGAKQPCAAQALQGAIQRQASTRPRHRDLLLRARRRIADGLSQRAKRLSAGATGLSATDRRLLDRRRTTESGRRTRGHSMTSTS